MYLSYVRYYVLYSCHWAVSPFTGEYNMNIICILSVSLQDRHLIGKEANGKKTALYNNGESICYERL